MSEPKQAQLFSQVSDLGAAQILIADLHDDFQGRVSRLHQLNDLSSSLGTLGALIPGGEVAYLAWVEARSSFVNGNYVATVMLCQGLAEHMLASHLSMGLDGCELPKKVGFKDTLKRCSERGVISVQDAESLEKLMGLRNPLSHYRSPSDPESLSLRALDSLQPAVVTLLNDASFAISVAIRLLSLPAFRLGQ